MAQLEELAARLAAPDAIMEPSAKATLRSFLTLGGGAAVGSEIRRPYGRRSSGVRIHQIRQLLNKMI